MAYGYDITMKRTRTPCHQMQQLGIPIFQNDFNDPSQNDNSISLPRSNQTYGLLWNLKLQTVIYAHIKLF